MIFPDSVLQQRRRSQLAGLVTRHTAHLFDLDGRFYGEEEGMREKMWFALAFLQSGDPSAIQKANAVIRRDLPGYRQCHFTPYICCQALLHFEKLLDADVVRIMERYILQYMPYFLTEEMDFVACNDNFPCMSTALCLFAGQRFGNPAYLATARKRLFQLRDMLIRRGFTAEFTSPTYTPIQAAVLAEIVQYAHDEELAQLALQGEQRVLADLLLHLHWETAQPAGPYSRAYPIDYAASTHHARFLYYMLYGDALTVNPVDVLFSQEHPDTPPDSLVLHHNFNFLRISFFWQALSTYHCPPWLMETARNRTYPAIVAGACESMACEETLCAGPNPGAERPENPTRVNFLYSYLERDYALGSCQTLFHSGSQTSSLQGVFRRPAEGFSDPQAQVGSFFLSYSLNNLSPGDFASGTGQVNDYGLRVCLQNRNTALAAYTPRIGLNREVSSLKLTVGIPILGPLPDELRLGDVTLKAEDYASEEGMTSPLPLPVSIRSGDVFLRFHPLTVTDCGRPWAMELRLRRRLLEITYLNYQGEPRDFSSSELAGILNGVACEVRSRREAGSFDSFCQSLSQKTQVEDWLFMEGKGVKIRQLRYQNGRTCLEMLYAPKTQSVRYQMVDGVLQPQPKLYATGADLSQLPLMEPQPSLAQLAGL